ncbi:MAG: phosphate ABC transporter permease subunit PstC [Rhodospirillaceae bacterium]|nr:phosphate ABC transporter permease subunit PstC [Rhodospirillaceae bacterium]
MTSFVLAVTLLLLTGFGYFLGRGRALARVNGRARDLHSLPGYYGYYLALWCAIPGISVFAFWLMFGPGVIEHIVLSSLSESTLAKAPGSPEFLYTTIERIADGQPFATTAEPDLEAAAEHLKSLRQTSLAGMISAVLAAALCGLTWSWTRIRPQMRARNRVEHIFCLFLMGSSTIAVLTTVGIIFSLLFESLSFFRQIPILDFLFGLNWSPQTAIREDQVGSTDGFGAVPLFTGTLLITFIAMLVATPIGLMSAIYMADYASPNLRSVVKPVLEILAGIPTVVYGFFAALTVGPFLRDIGTSIGLDVASESALAAGGVMGIMIIPFISSLSDDIIVAVPRSLREGSYALGATKAETIRKVVLPAALPGVISACLLGVSRAIGETMIVVMAAGLAANLTANPLESVTTVTVQIVTLLVGDQEFDSPKTLSAFALGLVLFTATLVLNFIALRVVQKYREQYD